MGSLDDLFGLPRPPARPFPHPLPAVVETVEPGGLLFRLTDPDQDVTAVHGPARWSSPVPGGWPPRGTRCLVLFAGLGLDDPWVLAFDRWPH